MFNFLKRKPKALPSEENELPFQKLKEISWAKSPAHLDLLSCFINPKKVQDYTEFDRWTDPLGEPADKAIKRFIDLHLIETPDINQRLWLKYGIPELKQMLKDRGLHITGNKQILIDRLIENDAPGAKQAAGNDLILICSKSGLNCAAAYLEYEKQRRDSAIKNCEIALRADQYRAASLTMAQYETGRVFPRGLWSGPGGAVAHWKNYDTKRDEIILNYIFTRTPKLAIKRGWDKLPDVRFVAGMAHLLGNPKEAQKDYVESIRDGANSFLTHAMFLNEMDEFRSIGVFKYVKVSTCNDKNVCDPCNKLAKSKHLIDKMPELPYENCKEEHGCRCWIGVEI